MNEISNKLDEIARYIDRVQFRKQIFGVSTAEVYVAMQEMDNMYQEAMEHYSLDLEEEYDSREEVIQKNERKIRELAEKASSIVEARKRDQKRIRELEEKLRAVSRERSEYHSQTDILADSISNIQKCKEQILEQARAQALEIVRKAQEESRYISHGSMSAVMQEKEHYEDSLEKLRQAKTKAEDNLHLIRIDLYDLCEMLSSIREEMKTEEPGETQNVPDEEIEHTVEQEQHANAG